MQYVPRPTRHRYFIAFMVEGEAKKEIDQLREEISKKFDVHAALKIPPHITLIPPFDTSKINDLADPLEKACTTIEPFPLHIYNFEHFSDCVWYLHIKPSTKLVETRQKLYNIYLKTLAPQDRITLHPENDQRPFTAHITLAYKDLTPEKFRQIQAFLADRKVELRVSFNNISILKYHQHHWEIEHQFKTGPLSQASF